MRTLRTSTWLACRWLAGWRALSKTRLFLTQRSTTRVPGSAKKKPPPLSPRSQSCVHAACRRRPAPSRSLRQWRHFDRNFEQVGALGARRFLSGAFISQNRRRAFMVLGRQSVSYFGGVAGLPWSRPARYGASRPEVSKACSCTRGLLFRRSRSRVGQHRALESEPIPAQMFVPLRVPLGACGCRWCTRPRWGRPGCMRLVVFGDGGFSGLDVVDATRK